MIARTWTGRTKREHAEAYVKVFEDTGLAAMKEAEGNAGAWLLRRIDADIAEFVVISLWNSFEDIKTFAGTDVDKARYFPEDDAYLLEKPDSVLHYEVAYATTQQ